MGLKVIFAVLAIASIAHGSIFMSCGSDKQPTSINVSNCNNEYCEVRRNQDSNVELTFKTDSEATDLKAKLRAQVIGLWLPWPLGKLSKVCDNLKSGKCPLAANTEATYSFAIKIPSIAPVGTRVTVEVKITDQNAANVACTRIPVYIAA